MVNPLDFGVGQSLHNYSAISVSLVSSPLDGAMDFLTSGRKFHSCEECQIAGGPNTFKTKLLEAPSWGYASSPLSDKGFLSLSI